MRFYESIFIARQDLAPTQVEALTEMLAKIVKDNGGRVKKTEYCGLRPLAYPIKKNRKGHYVLLGLEAPNTLVTELERNMRIREDVLRYLTVEVEALEEGASPLLKQSRNYVEGNPARATESTDEANQSSDTDN